MLAPRRWRRVRDPSIRVARLRSFKYGMVMVLVGIIRRPVIGVVAGTRTPVIPANGEEIGLARIGRRTVIMAGGVPMRGREFRPTGFGVPAVAPLIIPSQIGEAQAGAGVIRSR